MKIERIQRPKGGSESGYMIRYSSYNKENVDMCFVWGDGYILKGCDDQYYKYKLIAKKDGAVMYCDEDMVQIYKDVGLIK